MNAPEETPKLTPVPKKKSEPSLSWYQLCRAYGHVASIFMTLHQVETGEERRLVEEHVRKALKRGGR